VSSMQENALHGWRLADSRNMRMTGYPGKTRSMSWSHDGAWLATSGAEAAIVWPFKDKDGPMGKAPRECGVREARVTKVAFHPRALVVAIGYADGLLLLCRLADAAEILVRQPGGGPVSAIGWDAAGDRLIFGLESGEAGFLNLSG
jgi:WD40 repeat protein